MNPYHRAVRKPLTPQELETLWSNLEVFSNRMAHWAREQNSLNFQREAESLEGNLRKLKAHEFAVAVEAKKAQGINMRITNPSGIEDAV